MLSQRDLAFRLIDHVVAHCPAAQAEVSAPFFLRAVGIVKAGGQITPIPDAEEDGWYRVKSESGDWSYTVTPRGCTCKSQPPEGVLCKHRYAVQLAQYVASELQKRSKQRHEHAFLCGHGRLVCWDKNCKATWHTQCQVCSEASAEDPEAALAEREAQAVDAEVNEARLRARLEAQMYEVAPPQPAPMTRIEAQPMPEAPASLNIKLKIGQYEMMYTMRSMHTGAAGDAELAERLTAVRQRLAQEATLIKTEIETAYRQKAGIEMKSADDMRYESAAAQAQRAANFVQGQGE